MCSWDEPLGRDCGFIDFWSLTFQMLSTGTPIISQNTTFDFNSNVEFYFQQFAVLILLYGRLQPDGIRNGRSGDRLATALRGSFPPATARGSLSSAPGSHSGELTPSPSQGESEKPKPVARAKPEVNLELGVS